MTKERREVNRWSAEDDRVLLQSWGNGAKAEQIAAQLGKSLRGVYGRRHLLGLPPRTKPVKNSKPVKWSAEMVETVRVLSAEHRPVQEIADQVGATYNAVLNLCRVRGINRPPKHSRWTAERDKELLTLLQEGKTVNEISAIIDRSLFAIRGRCYVLGITRSFPQLKALIKVLDKRPVTIRGALRYRLTSSKGRYGHDKCDLTIEYLLDLYAQQGGRCFYTGLELSPEANHDRTLSIDRIDSSVGYVKGNVVLCVWDANGMKQDLKQERFIELCHLVAAQHPLTKAPPCPPEAGPVLGTGS